jgi:putative transposase
MVSSQELVSGDEIVTILCRPRPGARRLQRFACALERRRPRCPHSEASQSYGRVNEHNGWVPRDFWLEPWEKEAIIGFHLQNPLEGYRRLTFMMQDADVVAVSPASVWRVLQQAGLLSRWKAKASRKGSGFEQPLQPHQHWHVDVSYINLSGTFYYLCSVLDGCSRFLVHWDLRESMKEADIEMILERAKEKYPEAKPRIISDNGPQFLARDFKEFIRISGMTHVRTSPFYPQSNGKIERWHKSLKQECIRPLTPLTLEDARRLILGRRGSKPGFSVRFLYSRISRLLLEYQRKLVSI